MSTYFLKKFYENFRFAEIALMIRRKESLIFFLSYTGYARRKIFSKPVRLHFLMTGGEKMSDNFKNRSSFGRDSKSSNENSRTNDSSRNDRMERMEKNSKNEKNSRNEKSSKNERSER